MFGSEKWANDINVKSLERVRQRDRVEQCLGGFPEGLALGTGLTCSTMVFHSCCNARPPDSGLNFL